MSPQFNGCCSRRLGNLVLRNLVEKIFSLVDRGVSDWASHIESEEALRVRTTQRLRRLTAMALVALFVVPALFTMVFGAAIALPVGAALVCVCFLVGAAMIVAFHRADKPEQENGVVTPAELVTLNSVPGALLVLNEMGTVVKSAGRDLGLFPKTLRSAEGKVFAELLHISDRLSMLQALDSLRQGTRDVVADVIFENHGLERDEQFIHIRLDMTAERDNRGRVIRIIAHLTDLTERQELVNEIERRTFDAVSANDAKSRFLAAVSHELRTPLNAVLGFADILAGEYFGKLENDRQREYVGLIRQSGAHLLSVVNSMLDMSKLEAGRYELLLSPFDIAQSVKACESMLGLQARDKGVTLTSRIARDLGEVVADQRAIQQVLINLAGNAIKFTDAGGVVTMDANRQGNLLKLTVSDTGIGIADDMLSQLGTPFTQVQTALNRGFEGTGLGLALVKGFVALHGGKLDISSRLGEGTVVSITMPIDGSGVVAGSQEQTKGDMVEFPPRLKPRHDDADVKKEEDQTYGTAKANIA